MNSYPQSIRKSFQVAACCLMVGIGLLGCRTRCDYRREADCEVSSALHDKQCDDRWLLPLRPVEPDRTSRMADHSCADCGPLPPDDPAAHCFMEFPDRFHGWPHWHDCGDLPHIEFSEWQNYLPVDEDGVLRLNREKAIELARLHSRDYQDQVELLYFTALAFTLERFEFSTQWFFRSSQIFDAIGNGANESRPFASTRNGGFTRNLTIGGQLLVDFANSFVWEFSGNTVSNASSGILVSLTQPLLRGAFRQVRLESLTQAERNLLYDVRDFARFRRIFYVDIVGNGYLPLLATAQAIKNQEKNLESLELNLQEHEQLSRAGLVAPIQVDQVFQQYQQGRLNMLAARQSLQSALDQFKLALGLPPQMEIELEEDVLRPFELNNPKIEELQDLNEEFRLALIQRDDVPTLEELKQSYEKLKERQKEIGELKDEISQEFKQWSARLKEAGSNSMSDSEDDQDRLQRQRALAERLGKALDQLDELIEEDVLRVEAGAEGKWIPEKTEEDGNEDKGGQDETDQESDEKSNKESDNRDQLDAARIKSEASHDRPAKLFRLIGWFDDEQPTVAEAIEKIETAESSAILQSNQSNGSDRDSASQLSSAAEDSAKPKKTKPNGKLNPDELREKLWEGLKQIVGRRLRGQLSDLFVIQTQIRVYLIESTPTEIDAEQAIQTALSSRLDLMNARGNVVDAYRRVEVAADALEAELNLQLQANLGTDPNRSNPVRFDASANRYRVGVEFDSPLTRLAERNSYRAAQINYQQARRAYMALKDAIVADIRQDIRRVEFDRFSFEISKLQLLTAARQVDEAQLNLRNSSEPNSSSTRNLLEALQGLLAAKNGLIQSWVSYEASRMALYRDLEDMQIAPDGTWINESAQQSDAFTDFNTEAQDGSSAFESLDGTEFERQFIDDEPDQRFEGNFDGDVQIEPIGSEPLNGEPADGLPLPAGVLPIQPTVPGPIQAIP